MHNIIRIGFLILCFIHPVFAQGGEQLDPLERSWPDSHPTRSGAPATWPEPVMDNAVHRFMQADRLEIGAGDNDDINVWDVQGWMGGDHNKFWFKSEGEGVLGESPEEAELQTLYSRTVSPFWDVQIGARYDVRPDPDRGHAVIGLQGLAPYWFEVDTAAFVSDRGDVTFRAELEYELLLSQRWILQPRLELNAAAQDMPEYGIGSGFSSIEAGLRLRYEIRRELSPYIGVSWSRTLGSTADLVRSEGEPVGNTVVVIGLRLWY